MKNNVKKQFFFDGLLAEKYGVNEAILLQNFIYWMNENKISGRNKKEERIWVFDTISAFQKKFFFLSEKQIRTAIDRLVAECILMKGNFNQDKFDRTMWYAFVNEEDFLFETAKSPSRS